MLKGRLNKYMVYLFYNNGSQALALFYEHSLTDCDVYVVGATGKWATGIIR